MLPTLALIKNEKVIDYIVGLDDVGGSEDFKQVPAVRPPGTSIHDPRSARSDQPRGRNGCWSSEASWPNTERAQGRCSAYRLRRRDIRLLRLTLYINFLQIDILVVRIICHITY
eukprot:720706-Prorocentrum_minimum.AAC.2